MKRKLLLANIAGILDGEGSFGVDYNPRMNSYLPRVQVNMTAEQPLRRLVGLFGGSLCKPKKLCPSCRKQPYHYTASGKNARALIDGVLPYLVEKREQAELLITLQNHIDEWNRKPRQRGNLPAEVMDSRRSWYLQSKDLKSRSVSYSGQDALWTDRERKAYFSGYLEAEGCFMVSRGKGNHFYSYIAVQVSSSAPLSILQRIYGGPIAHRTMVGKRDLFVWVAKGRRSADICRDIRPYLIFRHEEVDIVRTLQNTTDYWAKKVGRKGMPEWLTAKRVEWMERIRRIHKPERAETKPEQPRKEVSDSPICNELSVAGPELATV